MGVVGSSKKMFLKQELETLKIMLSKKYFELILAKIYIWLNKWRPSEKWGLNSVFWFLLIVLMDKLGMKTKKQVSKNAHLF